MVTVEVVRACHYKAKPCGLCGMAKTNAVHRKPDKETPAECPFQRKLGCARCGRPKSHADHLGAPESFNAFAGRDPNVYRSMIDRWSPVLSELLEASGLPKGLERVEASGEVSFGDATERDQGNHRVIVEKALGDALVRGGWLVSDVWSRYTFGDLRLAEDGSNRTRLFVVPCEAVDLSRQVALDLGDG